ncbi:TonB-dependent receptor [Pacificimonas sp. ICDLI1SI03]|jgi:iron complex outermembrane receptor protein|tara:strand:+ start:218210 stop:220597 length:2388 start_codon:yes stop_codon:yes gene_type:complete
MLLQKALFYRCTTAIALVISAGTAHAQIAPVEETAEPAAPNADVNRGQIGEIVVTARRQSESLQSTPIAITALDSGAIAKLNITEVDKIADVAPNLIISQQSSSLSAASINIRGIGQTDPSLGLDTAVGIYLDGVYIARSAGSIFDLVDLERIEVLRGPQGTLFGRNTTGGAIQLVSREPEDEFGLSLRGGYGSRNDWFGHARVDTGRTDGSPFSASISYFHRERDGYFDNLLTSSDKDPGSLNADAVAVAIKADLNDVQLSYGFDFDNRVGAPGFFQTVALSPAALEYYGNSPNLGGAPLQFVGADERLDSGLQAPGAPGDFRSRTRSMGHNFTAEWEVSPAITLKSITGYRDLLLDNVLGLSGQGDLKGLVLDPVTGGVSVQSVTPYNGVNAPQKQDQFSEELQLLGNTGDFSYVLGAYYFEEQVSEDNQQKLTAIIDANAGTGNPPLYLGINLNPRARYSQESKSKAVFGQVSWKPSALEEKLELTGGVRYTEDEKSVLLQNEANGVSSVIGPAEGTVKYDDISFLASASYQVTPDALLYGKFSTGYKSGGFNPRADELNSFEPEKLKSYEVGAKLDLFDRHLRINAAAFLNQYDDLQVPQFAAGTGGASTLLVNAGEAEFKGVELEVTLVPVDGLTLSGAVGYTDPTYQQFLFLDPTTNTVSDIADSARFPNVAKVNSNIAAEYIFPPMEFGEIQTRVSYSYRSKVFFYPNDAVNPYQQQVSSPATNTVDARIALADIPLGVRLRGEIAAIGENLLNEDQVLYGIDFGALGFGGKFYSEPRRFAVQFKLNY